MQSAVNLRRLFLSKKTGFDVKDVTSPINIRDSRGIMFYTTEALAPKVKKFNLPAGEYFVDSGSFTESLMPRSFPSIILPMRERWIYPDPKGFKILFGNNRNKCTVDWVKKTITFDISFKEKPLYEIDIILFHEYGHRLYKTEKYCDVYAAKCMLKVGYNPSQIQYAIIDSLSDYAEDRKEFIIDSFS